MQRSRFSTVMVAAASALALVVAPALADEPDEPEAPSTARVLATVPPPGEATLVVFDDSLTDPAPGASASPPSTGRTIAPITITGRLFYNDRRTQGHFASRVRPDGTPGTQCARSASCGPNWLSAKNMVVDAYEIDRPRSPPRGTLCEPRQRVASATVDDRGVFRLTIDKADACDIDRLAGIAIQLQFRAAFCGATTCYLIRPENGLAYAVSHPQATQSGPRIVRPGQSVTMPDAFFNTAANPDVANFTSVAANYFAALVDTMTFVHETNSVPFYRANYGGLSYVYPSTRSKTATARSPTEVVISHFSDNSSVLNEGTENEQLVTEWPRGKVVAHEYGHILMQRAWDGGYGVDLVGKSAGDYERAQAPRRQRAFKEAWAEFVANATFSAQYGCRVSTLDDNDPADYQRYLANRIRIALPVPHFVSSSGRIFGPPEDGQSYRFNVRKMLCDWYDDRNDDDPAWPGAGDAFQASNFQSMWYSMRRMYVDRDAYGGRFRDFGLTACDWVNYYRTIRRPEDRARIDDLIANNNISCAAPVSVGRVRDPELRTATSPRVALPADAPISGD